MYRMAAPAPTHLISSVHEGPLQSAQATFECPRGRMSESPRLAGACLWRQRSAVVDVAEGTFVEKPSRTVADSRRGCRAENIISHLLERDFAIKLHFQLEPCNFQRYFCGKRFCTCDGAVSKGLGHCVLDLALRIDANHF
jgi:hypothetical protein